MIQELTSFPQLCILPTS